LANSCWFSSSSWTVCNTATQLNSCWFFFRCSAMSVLHWIFMCLQIISCAHLCSRNGVTLYSLHFFYFTFCCSFLHYLASNKNDGDSSIFHEEIDTKSRKTIHFISIFKLHSMNKYSLQCKTILLFNLFLIKKALLILDNYIKMIQ
jgi:hypothetical protein